ncbi:DUF1289 domain-containing protein [Colwellia sp. E2M01]|uniref:DUF1289 domain-containing protein n=1 Tax=Colwellia sp. E2M01 TaxID=2841561 RepID=UPI001C0A21A7|nr:DUF1289 domain-containing protein [Colwellia sp. E2M01]MBU2869642.1 DUF1289 domain-containing protein [Colwellia sp. E2M01]
MQLDFFDIPSPCISVCQSDEKGNCLGCLRSREERQTWKDLNNDDKQKVIKRCIQRKKRKDNKKNAKQADVIIQEPLNTQVQPSLLDSSSNAKPLATIETDTAIDFGDFEL